MELLIPGLILVGLMVYLSTRIKKSAAAAFEREELEMDGFSVTKPEGFLHPLNSDSGLPFEAYTKEFGEDAAKRFRHARAELTVHAGAKFEKILQNVRKDGTITLEKASNEGGRQVGILDIEKQENGVDLAVYHKVVKAPGRIYDLKITALEEKKDAFSNRIEEMRDSFTVK